MSEDQGALSLSIRYAQRPCASLAFAKAALTLRRILQERFAVTSGERTLSCARLDVSARQPLQYGHSLPHLVNLRGFGKFLAT